MADTKIFNKYGPGDAYHTPPSSAAIPRFPTPLFYYRLFFGPLGSLHKHAVMGKCDDATWARHSAWFADILESIGCTLMIDGMNEMESFDGPCVFVANHMSTLETFLLPGIIRPRKKVTFIVKESLVTMPYFGPIMRSRNPVVVKRKNPRDDLKVTLTEGVARLANGISIIVFPQHTRSTHFTPENFNSIGEKLAARAKVPIVPIALKTDAWGQGKRIKELGKIRPQLPVRVHFGKSCPDAGNRGLHQEICNFIDSTLSQWQAMDGK